MLGISTDSQPSHRVYAQTLGGLPYPLLSDFHPKGQTAQAYSVWNDQRGASLRAIIVIDKDGVIRYKRIWSSGRPDPLEILEEVRRIE